METFGQLLRDHRLARGFNQTDLAERVGVTQSFLGKLERGEKCPSPRITSALATVLRVEDRRAWRYAAALAHVPRELRDAVPPV